ncbi:general secretion pathway protein GspB [Marinobacter sp. 1Y8]
MSYILDALRKSESERQQGRVPDLSQSVQMVHKPRRKGIPVAWWLAVALFFNGAIVALVFWPGAGLRFDSAEGEVQPAAQASAESESQDVPSASQNRPEAQPVDQPTTAPTDKTSSSQDFKPIPTIPVETAPKGNGEQANPPMQEAVVLAEQPTLIVPTRNTSARQSDSAYEPEREYDGVPHLIEMPLSFQRQIPSLRFNSHIYASDPAARRVIINDKYLRSGDSFSGLRVVAITSDGVILSRIGTEFRVGVVRDWVTPR